MKTTNFRVVGEMWKPRSGVITFDIPCKHGWEADIVFEKLRNDGAHWVVILDGAKQVALAGVRKFQQRCEKIRLVDIDWSQSVHELFRNNPPRWQDEFEIAVALEEVAEA